MIRPVLVSDADRLLRLWQDTAFLAHPSLSPDFWSNRQGLALRWFNDPVCGLVYCDGTPNRPDGFILVERNGNLPCLFVGRALQGFGIGRALVDAARERSADLRVSVLEENLGARYFLQQCGFIEENRYFRIEANQQMLTMVSDERIQYY